jgi:hypothetical protein
MLSSGRVAAVSAGVLALGFLVPRSPAWALALSTILVAVAVSVRLPAVVLVAVLPGAYASWRLGPASVGLSLADATLLVGAVAAVPFVPWGAPGLRRALAGLAAYEAILLLAVAGHPSERAVVEWGHRILLVGGSLMVGAALVRLVSLRPAIRFYLVASAVVAAAACTYAVTHHFQPAYPFGFQKNAAGLLLALAFLVSVVAPRLAGVPVGLLNPLRVLLVLGMLATQSRGSMVATIAGLAAVQLFGSERRRAAPLVLVAALAMCAVVVVVTQSQDERARLDPSAAKYYGIGARQAVNSQAMEIWSHQRPLGAGLRYFRDPVFATSEPHNVLIVSLAETGVVGLVGLLLLLVAAGSALRGLTGELATLARVVFVVRLLGGMFDIFWVAGRGSLPWVLVGAAVSVHATRPAMAEATVA